MLNQLVVGLVAVAITLVLIFYNPFHIESERRLLGEEIKALTSNLSCQIDTDCKTVGFGSRPCGGFSEYIIYSTKSVGVQKMNRLSAKYYALDKQYNRANPKFSICALEMPKKSACIHSECIDLVDN